jgi:uncharacterized protein YjiS (DUF1127 family)
MTTYTANCTRDLNANTDHVSKTFNQFLTEWLATMKLKAKIAAERCQLSTLSDDMLRDIGINRGDATLESMRRDIPAERI